MKKLDEIFLRISPSRLNILQYTKHTTIYGSVGACKRRYPRDVRDRSKRGSFYHTFKTTAKSLE